MKRFFITALLVVVLLGVIVFRIFRQSHSHGLSVGVVTTQCNPQDWEITARQLRLRIQDDGSLLINDDPVSPGQLAHRLDLIFKTRFEKILFFEGSDSVSYQDAVAVIDIAQSSVPGLRIILIPPSTRKKCQQLYEQIPGGS